MIWITCSKFSFSYLKHNFIEGCVLRLDFDHHQGHAGAAVAYGSLLLKGL